MIPADGDYYLWVREGDHFATTTGSYSFTLQRKNGPGNIIATLSSGDSRSGSINPVTEIDVYEFSATALDEISVPWTGSAAWGFRLAVELYDEAGTLIERSATGGSSGTLLATIPADGTYFLWIRESNHFATNSGSYSFTLNLTPPAP